MPRKLAKPYVNQPLLVSDHSKKATKFSPHWTKGFSGVPLMVPFIGPKTVGITVSDP